ncbi:HpcH/HpaI aldolase/citrate lyase family protein [Pontixanthobacter aquaemixtae]|uniref:CoA ester lyase n=1 Tax=Pontixanthobacter aquaemixtae TaxID=1958940 RepID=A0A844ZN36_9SPHN|nr:CoA ester lyase [Pontixanthobacter aquaemixtae]MXO89791.1 CoA ester lyase [Pontixanthobacter aquaemixtae]
MPTPAPFKARSWLFAPGDSEKKMGKAADGDADIVLLDLEDSVMPENKGAARELVAGFLSSREDRERLWVRVNPLSGGETAADLAAIMPARPGGLLLPKAEGRGDVETLDQMLTEHEAKNGIAAGSTKVAALVTETAKAMFHTGDYAGAPRLVAMSWGAEDLSSALGARIQFQPNGAYMPTFELARSLCLLGAAAASVAPIETIQSDFRDLDGLRERALMVRSQGYRGMLAIHPAQVPIINEAFTPSAEELSEARAIIAAFDANPGAGTVGLNGAMLDRPHLELARALLASAE